MNYNDPDLGMIARALLAKNGVETKVVYTPLVAACRNWSRAISRKWWRMRAKVSTEMQQYIAQGYDIVALVPSCALMLNLEWPLLVPKMDAGL